MTHSTPGHNSYSYFFTITRNEMLIPVRLDFYEESENSHEEWDIAIELNQVDGEWRAIITSNSSTVLRPPYMSLSISGNPVGILRCLLNSSTC